MKSRNLSSINTPESIDAPIDPEFLEQVVTGAIIGHKAKIWLEEHFGGDQSDDYYRGLIAGYTHCRNLEKVVERDTWNVWISDIITYVAIRLA